MCSGRCHGWPPSCDAVPVAMTFEPHPQAVITGRVPELICDPDEKLVRMGEAGAELVVVQRFDEAFRAQTAEEFLDRLGRGRDLAGLVMSPESAFGRDRQGTIDTVRRLAEQDGWRLVEIDTLEIDGARVSSGRIRELVAAGDLDGAARLLGRRYAVTGTVAAAARRVTLRAAWRPTRCLRRAAMPVSASWSDVEERGGATGRSSRWRRAALGSPPSRRGPGAPVRVRVEFRGSGCQGHAPQRLRRSETIRRWRRQRAEERARLAALAEPGTGHAPSIRGWAAIDPAEQMAERLVAGPRDRCTRSVRSPSVGVPRDAIGRCIGPHTRDRTARGAHLEACARLRRD